MAGRRTDPIEMTTTQTGEGEKVRHRQVGEHQVEGGFALALITSRQNISPKHLVEPGPTPAALQCIFEAAAAAPDHGVLKPWRFVIIPEDKREKLAEVFALALIDRDPGATLAQIEDARQKAYRAPLLMLVVAQLGACEPFIPPLERMISVGAAVQNMLLAAHAMSLGAGLTSGRAMQSVRMRQLFQLVDGEEAVCFVNLGSAAKRKPLRVKPQQDSFVRTL
jgi:nitroreductase